MKALSKNDLCRVSGLAIAVLVISLLHYNTQKDEIYFHVIFRELYFLPIIVAGFWYGLRGGLLTAVAITVFYLPFVLLQLHRVTGHDLGNILQILLFNVLGLLVGCLRDRQRYYLEQKQKAETLAALGRAASCIAHDMKTPLAVIGGFAQQIRRTAPDDEKNNKKLKMISSLVERLELLVKDMLAFAKPLSLNYSEDSVQRLLKETLAIASAKAKHHKVLITMNFSAEDHRVHFDFHRLQQALLNIIVNAIEASPEEGIVTVSTLHRGKQLTIEVTDQGPGIPAERLEELLTPFITTKKEGTGLGLSIVKKILDAHGGGLELRNNSPTGALFRLNIPKKGKGVPPNTGPASVASV